MMNWALFCLGLVVAIVDNVVKKVIYFLTGFSENVYSLFHQR